MYRQRPFGVRVKCASRRTEAAGLACFFSLSLVVAVAPAQVRETTTVEVVEVPVYVGANGEPVLSLTRENFQLFVNGKLQPIEYFDTSLKTEDDVRTVLSLPVIATIPLLTQTMGDVRVRARLRWSFTAGAAAIVIAIATIVWRFRG